MKLVDEDRVLVARNGDPNLSRALIICHGMGENRSGINYLFAELAGNLAKKASVLRFDLAGLGENTERLTIKRWREQCVTALQLALRCGASRVDIAARGAGWLAVPQHWEYGSIVAIEPLLVSRASAASIQRTTRKIDDDLCPASTTDDACDPFWLQAGVEPSLLGGLRIPRSFLDEMAPDNRTLRPDVIFHGSNAPDIGSAYGDLVHRRVPVGKDPLFRMEDDRVSLTNAISDFLYP